VECRYSFTIPDLGTRRKGVASFKLRPLYPQRNIPRYSLDRRLGGPKSSSGLYGMNKKSLALQGIEILLPGQ
jgi:hypothetical protein